MAVARRVESCLSRLINADKGVEGWSIDRHIRCLILNESNQKGEKILTVDRLANTRCFDSSFFKLDHMSEKVI